MRKGLKDFRKDFNYTWQHKKAFLIMEKRLTGTVSLAGLLHDMDKLFLYLLFTKKETSNIHRSYARHHWDNVRTNKEIVQMLIDWECNRLTKPDKQESAREYLAMTYPKFAASYEKYLKELGL